MFDFILYALFLLGSMALSVFGALVLFWFGFMRPWLFERVRAGDGDRTTLFGHWMAGGCMGVLAAMGGFCGAREVYAHWSVTHPFLFLPILAGLLLAFGVGFLWVAVAYARYRQLERMMGG